MLKLMRMVVLEGFAQPSGSSGVSSRRCVTRFAPLNDSLYCVSTSQQMVIKAPTEMRPPALVASDSSEGTRRKKCASRMPMQLRPIGAAVLRVLWLRHDAEAARDVYDAFQFGDVHANVVHAHRGIKNITSPPVLTAFPPPEYNSQFTLKSAALRGLHGMASELAVSAAAHAGQAGQL